MIFANQHPILQEKNNIQRWPYKETLKTLANFYNWIS